MMYGKDNVGVVAIGRNEGERLKRCLKSVYKEIDQVVYVDSGSSDQSVDYARSISVEVVNLDMTIPFSAGRARNEGFEELISLFPHIEYVQFIDGDCELFDGWLEVAYSYLERDDSCAIVAGRRKERYPDRSIYNLLCDIEWNTPIGRAISCGGDFMIRKKAFQQVNGFNPIVIAGEEPELCYRLAEKKWTIYRLDRQMTLHDADITQFSQWWKRMVRTGHAYAQGYFLHGRKGKKYCRSQLKKILAWAIILPFAVVILSITFNTKFFLFFIMYFFQFSKIAINANKRLMNSKQSLLYSFFIVLSKWPQLIGLSLFLYRVTSTRDLTILEYK